MTYGYNHYSYHPLAGYHVSTETLGPSIAEVCSASTMLMTFMTMLDVYIRMNDKISGFSQRVHDTASPKEEYDYVVVGGGTAGSVVGARLSEIPEATVLVLEAGPDEPAAGEVPSFATKFLGTRLDWNHTTTNEKNACLANGGSCAWPAGKNLGGNSVHSGTIYTRGSRKDFDNWAAMGNEGWSADEVLPKYLVSEDNQEIERVGTEYHATGGLLPVQRYPFVPLIDHSILAGAIEAGFGVSEDLTGEEKTGFSVAQATSKNGVKFSTAAAYLRPNRDRENLEISLESHVTRIIVEGGKAVGVEYYKNNEHRTVYARKEVIVTAGTVRSPHLLQVSGIGPKEHLESVGVPVVKDLPGVGENVHNHVAYRISCTTNDLDAYENNWAAAMEYLHYQTGPMSCIGLASVIGMFASSHTTDDHPDLQLYGSGGTAACAPGEIGALRSTGRLNVLLAATNTQPKSRGTIRLASSDPFDYPVIHANYLDHEDDLEVLLEGIDKLLTLMKTDAMQARDFALSPTPVAECSDYEYPSREYWTCAIKQYTFPTNHQAGSCKMGPESDPMAVVDPKLRVHGIEGLRIADASVMPQVTSGSPGSTVILIAERLAEWIKEDW